MEKLYPDIIRKIALELSPKDVISLCLCNKHFNKIINSDFWRNKILIDYPKQTYFLFLYQNLPKNLYKILNMKSKIVEIDIIDIGDYDEDDKEKAKTIAKFITKDFIYKNYLKRGDVLHLPWLNTYRNEGKFLWDGNQAIILNYLGDDYGSVPKEFTFPEFSPDYFSESISHNNIVRLTAEKIKEVVDNFDINTQKSYITDKYNRYEVILDSEEWNLDIKFSKIFLDKDYLDYDVNRKHFILEPGVIITGRFTEDYDKQDLKVSSKWKDSIITVKTRFPNTIYKWIEDALETVTYRK
jgi:hypothetical protein